MHEKSEVVEPMGLCATDANFKSFMDYRAVTDSTSPQWHYRTNGWTREDGVRMYEDRVQIAMGWQYGQIGDKVNIYLDTGTVIRGILGDSKGNRCYHSDGGTKSMVEFLVDSNKIPQRVWRDGSLESIFTGNIVKIERVLGAK